MNKLSTIVTHGDFLMHALLIRYDLRVTRLAFDYPVPPLSAWAVSSRILSCVISVNRYGESPAKADDE